VAVNCSVAVTPIPGLPGVTTIEVSIALVVFTADVPTIPPKTAVTVSIVEPLTPLGDIAVMLDVPVAFVMANPPGLIVATAV